MPKQSENDRKNAASDRTKTDTGSNVPHSRGGGQTDSATGNRPGGGGKIQSKKK